MATPAFTVAQIFPVGTSFAPSASGTLLAAQDIGFNAILTSDPVATPPASGDHSIVVSAQQSSDGGSTWTERGSITFDGGTFTSPKTGQQVTPSLNAQCSAGDVNASIGGLTVRLAVTVDSTAGPLSITAAGDVF